MGPFQVLPLDPSDDSDKKSVRMGGLLRNNSGVAIDNTISIRKIKSAVAAKKVVVAPLQSIPPIDERYLADALDDAPLIKGDNVMAPYFGGQLTFQVIGVTPTTTDDAVIVTEIMIFHVAKVTEKPHNYDEKISMVIDKILQIDSQNNEEFESMINIIRQTYKEFKKDQTDIQGVQEGSKQRCRKTFKMNQVVVQNDDQIIKMHQSHFCLSDCFNLST